MNNDKIDLISKTNNNDNDTTNNTNLECSSKNSECSQLLNVNIINEESNNLKQVSSSLLSISSITNKKFRNSSLSLNKKLGGTAASNLLSTIKNSTLNVLGKPLASRSPSPQSSIKIKKPIDLEAHIIVKKDNLNYEDSSENDENDENENSDDNDETRNEDSNKNKYDDAFEENHDGENENRLGFKENLNVRKKSILNLKRHSIHKSLSKDNSCKEEDEEDYENIESMVGDETFLSTGKKPKETSKLNTSSVPKPSLKTLSNCTTSSASINQLNKLVPPAKNDKKSSFKTNVILQHNDLPSHLEIQSKQVKIKTNSSETNNIANLSVQGVKSTVSSQTINQNPNNNINQPLKTILSNSNRNITTNATNLATTINNPSLDIGCHQHASSRQSVSFSNDTLDNSNKNNNETTNSNNNNNCTKTTSFQRSLNEEEEIKVTQDNLGSDIEKNKTPNRLLSVQINDDNNKKEFSKQDSVISAPASSQSYSYPVEYDVNKINKSLTIPNYENLNDKNQNDKLKPNNVDLALSSSFASTNTGFNSSYSPSINNKPLMLADQQLPIRVLHKSMTKGSKAMRIMGSSNTGIMSNGLLKNSPSSGAVSLKSNSSRGNGNKKQQQKRLFFKNGNINISRCNIDKRRRRYLTDIFTTLIDLKWRYNILVFALGFFVSWTLFAITWYLISYIHGDLGLDEKNKTVCISGIHGFAGAILFSIETQQTIGYGVRYTTENCPEAIFVMMIQSSVGVMIQSFMVGVVFAKLSRPKKRSETLMFSKNAVISLRDGRLCLICRVGDMRKSHIVEAHVRMYLIKKKVTLEGEIMPLHMYDLNVGWDKGLDRLFLVWPLTIEHNIDENSPFWTISAEDLKKERFELAVILEGIVESTGMTTQARSSYLVNEILWGHRFEKLITFQKEDGTYKIDYSRFDMTVPIDTPTCSAKDLAELKEEEKYYNLMNLNDSTPSTINSRDIINGNSDLRKRRVEESNKQDQNEENNNDESVVTTQLLTPKMIIEDHSDVKTAKTNDYFYNEDSMFDNLSHYNSNLNSTPNTTSTTLNAFSITNPSNTNNDTNKKKSDQFNMNEQAINLVPSIVDQNNQFFDKQLLTTTI